MFDDALIELGQKVIDHFDKRNLMIATAESCTSGLIAGLLTEIAGSSKVVDRGFVTYSNGAKSELLGVAPHLIDQFGAVSAQVAEAMVTGALERSNADIAVAVTGIAGPGGGTKEKPVGLVYIAVQRKGEKTITSKELFGSQGRSDIRLATVSRALALAVEQI